MKILVKDLQPNPFRHMTRYPVDRAKVEALKISINETGFWDNILVRSRGTAYELAYGHHRYFALKELGVVEIDVPVRDLDDATMLRIMANENMEFWGSNPAVINETVAAAKEFLDAELAKYETWSKAQESYLLNLIDRNLTEGKFQSLKQNGVDTPILVRFLGGNWKHATIAAALHILQSEEIDREAVEVFDKPYHVEVFVQAITDEDVHIPKVEQKRVAEKIKHEIEDEIEEWQNAPQEDRGTRPVYAHRLQDKVFEEAGAAEAGRTRKTHTTNKPDIGVYLSDCISRQAQTNAVLKEVLENRDYCNPADLHKFVELVSRTGEILKVYLKEAKNGTHLLT